MFVGNAVRWVIRDRLTLGARTGPAIGLFSRPGQFPFGFRQRSWDLNYALRSFAPVCGWGRLSTSRTHLPLCRLPAASFIVAGSFDHGVSCIGFWGLAPQTSRAVRSVGPAKAFAHRAESDSPAMTALSFDPFSGLILRPPASTSGAYPPMGFSRLAAASLQCLATTSRVPWERIEGPAICRSGGVSSGPAFPSKVFSPSVKRPSTQAMAWCQCVTQRGLF